MIKHYDRQGYEIDPENGERVHPLQWRSPAVRRAERVNEPVTMMDVCLVLAIVIPCTLLVGWVTWLVIG